MNILGANPSERGLALAGRPLNWQAASMNDSDVFSFGRAVIRYFDDLAIRKGMRI